MTFDSAGFERMLRDLLRAQQQDAETIAASLAAVRAARSDGTADDEHDPEGSTLTSDWSRIVGFARGSDARTEEILAALDRIGDGTYGTCTTCGQPVGDGRLDARPWAALCIECASRQEHRPR